MSVIKKRSRELLLIAIIILIGAVCTVLFALLPGIGSDLADFDSELLCLCSLLFLLVMWVSHC